MNCFKYLIVVMTCLLIGGKCFAANLDDLPVDPVRNQIIESALTSQPFSPLTNWLMERYIKLHGKTSMARLATLPRDACTIYFCPDCSKLLTTNLDLVVKIYRMADFKHIGTLGDNVYSIAMHPDSTRAITLSVNARIATIWNIADGFLIKDVRMEKKCGCKIVVSPDGSKFITLGKKTQIWNVADGKFIVECNHNWASKSAAITSDGKRIFVGLKDGQIKIFNAEDGSLIKTLPQQHSGSVIFIAINHNGSRLVTASESRHRSWPDPLIYTDVKLWNMTDDSVIDTFSGRITGRISCIAVNESFIFTGHENGSIDLYNMTNGAWIKTLDGGRHEISSIKISPDGTQLVTCAGMNNCWMDNLTKIWNMTDGSEIVQMCNVQSCEISPESSRIVLRRACDNGTATIWNMPLFPCFQVFKQIKIEQLPLLEWLRDVASSGKKINFRTTNSDPRLQRVIDDYRNQYNALPELIQDLVKDFVLL